MKRKTVALFNPYLDTLGGGEKHILSILQVLTNQAGFQPVIFWDTNLTKQIEDKLAIRFDTKPEFRTNVFSGNGSFMDKMAALKDIDMFFYVTDGSYFFSPAKKNYVFCMVPRKDLYSMSFMNIIKTTNYRFISNSRFTQNYLVEHGIRSRMLYPYVSDDYFALSKTKKKKNILVVGRFFEHLHSKRQDKAIEAFRLLKDNAEYKGYTLQLAGSVLPSDTDYLKKLQSMADSDKSIEFHINIPFKELKELYASAAFYWHFTGFDVDEKKQPHAVEHLGITPLEAMASGAITCCYKAGGPKEIIQDGTTGILFSSIDDLLTKMHNLSESTMKDMRDDAHTYVSKHFSYPAFSRNVLELFEITNETS